MFNTFFKRTSLVIVAALTLGCTSTQTTSAIDAFGDGMTGSIELRNANKPQQMQNHTPHGEDLTNGVLNMIFQSVVGLFSADKD